MKVIINGSVHDLEPGATVARAVQAVTDATAGLAVAINGEVVTRGSWEDAEVGEGDRIEVLTAVQGG